MKTISKTGIELIKSFEGLRLEAYKPVPTEIYWTIGYGHYGSDVWKGMSITKEQAESMLVSDLKRFEAYVNNSYYCPVTSQLNQNQFDALVSFTYNCGQGNLRVLCNNKSVEQIGKDIALYNKAGGIILGGLIRRRKAETELYHLAEGITMDNGTVDFILSVLGYYWRNMDGNKEIQDFTHHCANELRKAVGREEE